tara:strand:+ start:8822 stop:9535 length:714 start_codon:yes stop_codon:yes gene_type:complete
MKGKKTYIYSTQNSLWGESECIGFGTTDFYVQEIPKEISKKIIIENHYSKKVCNDATTHIHLGVFYKEKLKGALQFGYAMNPRSYSSIVSKSNINQYKELNRMWIDDNCIKYAESRAISYSIKYIKKKYPTVKWIQTFADERCGGYGIVYQACSFSFYGSHISTFWEFEGETFHNSIISNNNRNKKAELERRGFKEKATKKTLRQFRYIKFLDKREKKKCLLKEQPYPKHYEESKIN